MADEYGAVVVIDPLGISNRELKVRFYTAQRGQARVPPRISNRELKDATAVALAAFVKENGISNRELKEFNMDENRLRALVEEASQIEN